MAALIKKAPALLKKAPVLLNQAKELAMPKLNTFWRYAKVGFGSINVGLLKIKFLNCW